MRYCSDKNPHVFLGKNINESYCGSDIYRGVFILNFSFGNTLKCYESSLGPRSLFLNYRQLRVTHFNKYPCKRVVLI